MIRSSINAAGHGRECRGQQRLLVTCYAEAFALLLLPKPSEAQARQTRERNTCLKYYRFLMYDEPRSVPVPYVRRPLGIGPELCIMLNLDFREFPFHALR